MTDTDRIEKKLVLRAPRSRVWRALADSREFGSWFQLKLDGPFTLGARVRGRVLYPGFEHLTVEMAIERMDPELLFSYRWHPYPVDPAVYTNEPMTLVEFRLEEAPGGTLLTMVESGFDRIPDAKRRAEAFRMNDGGWTEQMSNLERHVSQG